MKTQSNLGPFMTLILTLTAEGKHADNVIHSSPAKVVNSLLFVRLVVDTLKQRSVRNTKSSSRVYRIGCAQLSRLSSSGLKR